MHSLLTGVAAITLAFGIMTGASQQALAGGGGGGGGDSAYQYVEMNPIMLPIIDKNGVNQVVNLIIALEVENGALAQRAIALQPKLTDAFIQDMYGALNKQAARHGGVLPLQSIKKRLLKVSNTILADEEHSVHDVLLQFVDQRRI